MEFELLQAAIDAIGIMADPTRLLVLSAGVLIGLIVGIIPGIGGLAGTALILPFTFTMDPATGIAFLLGLGSVITTGDSIPAILFGVPGTAGSAATVVDGYPMTKKGQAGRALAAAYLSSLLGGLFGAALLGLFIPMLRPFVLLLGSPELLAMTLFGISMVSVLSGSAPLRGLVAGCLGILFAMIGSDPQTGSLRWTMDLIYLYDGLPLLPVVLGIFALPELFDLAISKATIAKGGRADTRSGMMEGAKDVLKNWWLVIRCGWIGSGLGAVPGIGSAIIDWVAYGHAVRTEKGASETFGKGDVRGVIASESANNAREGGVLVPTIAFGVPGSAAMALLLSAFIVHGIVPGPAMLTTNLSLTYAMVWSVAIANILGAGLCFALSGQFAKLATLRYTIIFPVVFGITFIGAYSASRSWGDIVTLLLFGILGWTMKRLKWPRPPIILGFVLGELIERNLFVTFRIYGFEWLLRPIVIVVILLAAIGFMRPLFQELRAEGGLRQIARQLGRPRFYPGDFLYGLLIVLLIMMFATALPWPNAAQTGPLIVSGAAVIFLVLSMANLSMRRSTKHGDDALKQPAAEKVRRSIHMDLVAEDDGKGVLASVKRAGQLLAWVLGFLSSVFCIGMIPSVALFIVLFMRVENKEPWRLVLPLAFGVSFFIFLVFDHVLSFPWPDTLVGAVWPQLRVIPSV